MAFGISAGNVLVRGNENEVEVGESLYLSLMQTAELDWNVLVVAEV